MIALLIGLAVAAPPNLVLISVDGLRADRLGLPGLGPTPNLDRLAAEGLSCSLSFSQSNESLFSHAAMLTGRHVSEIARPDYQRFVVPETALQVPEVLALYGYTTAAFVAGGHVKGSYGFAQGFGRYEDEDDFGSFFHTVPRALRWLDSTPPSPFFLFLHGYDTHRPYQHAGLFFHVYDRDYPGQIDQLSDRAGVERIFRGVYYADFPVSYFWHGAAEENILDPSGYARLEDWAADHPGTPVTAADLHHLHAHYDSGALAADLHVGLFLDALKDRGLWENTLVLVTADHGEDLGDHGLFNHRSALFDSATRVPLILAGGALPKLRQGASIEGLCSALDVAPTLFAAAGARPPAGLTGRDLLGDGPPPAVVIQEGVLPMMAVRSATHRLVVNGLPLDSPLLPLMVRAAPIEAPTFQLFDLRADPGEQTNVLSAQPAVALQLRQSLLDFLASREAATHEGVQPLDPAFRALLQSRGYW
jgi:arylsulfatase A-like enzyme